MAHCCQSRNLISILFLMGGKNIFVYFLVLKTKNKINVNAVTLAQITFPDALSFSDLG